MHDAEGVEILDPEADLADKHDTGRLRQEEILVSDLDKQLPSVKILHHDDDGGGVRVAVHIPDDVLVVQALQDGDLLVCQLSVGPPSGLDKLGGETLLRFHFPNKINHPESALTELIKKKVLQQKICLSGEKRSNKVSSFRMMNLII